MANRSRRSVAPGRTSCGPIVACGPGTPAATRRYGWRMSAAVAARTVIAAREALEPMRVVPGLSPVSLIVSDFDGTVSTMVLDPLGRGDRPGSQARAPPDGGAPGRPRHDAVRPAGARRRRARRASVVPRTSATTVWSVAGCRAAVVPSRSRLEVVPVDEPSSAVRSCSRDEWLRPPSRSRGSCRGPSRRPLRSTSAALRISKRPRIGFAPRSRLPTRTQRFVRSRDAGCWSCVPMARPERERR